MLVKHGLNTVTHYKVLKPARVDCHTPVQSFQKDLEVLAVHFLPGVSYLRKPGTLTSVSLILNEDILG